MLWWQADEGLRDLLRLPAKEGVMTDWWRGYWWGIGVALTSSFVLHAVWP